ncbi:MAG: tRNA glutamyl-Q(34) synthetase GluQRS [Desulfuromonas sp.]|uniref:tRNA glutamyl-Q(34) synthetase GluQRS n=1 Tax=Desulfuromonas sp. TaxID=892 RepID=UPI000CAAFA69|nr:tRNA glutamyl-Q(34) synthetase GluQRS [Desulfuromonas sp.]PLX83845.1 MAG: tRNA glutamyl-Q(34) synthetase GluQRS [Desulfuromonas sp.]
MDRQHPTPQPTVGRFAPSPTGALHFGSLVTAVGSYCLARQTGGKWLMRMEDLDTPRVVPGAADEILWTLEALGFEWDEEVLYQSRRTDRYEAALERLREQGRIFDCGCTRKEILASAPHPGEEGPVYPGTCRHGLAAGRRPRALRVRVPEEKVCFADGLFGAVEQHLVSAVGDFVLRRADGLFAYQLAVVVDDAECGVNQVVRGADLLSSTPRQVFLYACLGWPPPRFVHLPLALAPDGEKISKRHGTLARGDLQEGGGSLCRALRFLGQQPPAGLDLAPARDVLSWAIAHFDLKRVPSRSRPAEG